MKALDFDRAQIKKNWTARGFSCSLWTDPPGQIWDGYIHDTDELLMLCDGALEIEMNDAVFRPDIGKEILIPANTRHTVRNIGKTQNHWLYGYKLR